MYDKFVLLNLKLAGFKSIENELSFQFTNKHIDKDFYDRSNVKAIYGTNGSGKTAIAHALELYKNVVCVRNFLLSEKITTNFIPLINKKSNRIFIDIYFALLTPEGNVDIFHHIIDFKLESERLIIDKETLLKIKGSTIGNSKNEVTLYSTNKGRFDFINDKYVKDKELILDTTKNLLNIVSASYLLFDVKIIKKQNNKFINLLLPYLFAGSLNIFIESKDHFDEDLHKKLAEVNFINLKDFRYNLVITEEDDKIPVSRKSEYLHLISQIASFIKVFKPALKEISISTDIVDKTLICKKTMVYNNGVKISSKYESNGIKKLFGLYAGLNNIEQGGITFIDEFDSNIHDVYLCKLVEYFIGYTNGQLIFTTHNLGPMEVLSKYSNKHSIDFINEGTVTSWKRNGNYSVVNLYRDGLIPNSPFNLDASKFIKVFGDNND